MGGPYKKLKINGRTVYEYREIVARREGRPLGRFELVHHENHVKTDNTATNLELTTPLEHARHHMLKHPVAKPCVICGAGAAAEARVADSPGCRYCGAAAHHFTGAAGLHVHESRWCEKRPGGRRRHGVGSWVDELLALLREARPYVEPKEADSAWEKQRAAETLALAARIDAALGSPSKVLDGSRRRRR